MTGAAPAMAISYEMMVVGLKQRQVLVGDGVLRPAAVIASVKRPLRYVSWVLR